MKPVSAINILRALNAARTARAPRYTSPIAGSRKSILQTKHASQWVARPKDPELEAIMLQRLMVRFGVSETKAASEVAATSSASSQCGGGNHSRQPARQRPARTGGDGQSAGDFRGNTIIVVNDAFDRSWRKVGLAIEGAGLAVEDKDREKGIYYLRPIKLETGWLDKLKFWKSNEDTTRHYRVYVKDGGTACEVSITDQNGASNKVSKEMLEAILQEYRQAVM